MVVIDLNSIVVEWVDLKSWCWTMGLLLRLGVRRAWGIACSLFNPISLLFLFFIPCRHVYAWKVWCVVLVSAFDCNHTVHIPNETKDLLLCFPFYFVTWCLFASASTSELFSQSIPVLILIKELECCIACCNGMSAKGNKVKLQHEHAASVVLKSSPWLFLFSSFPLCWERDFT